MKIEPSKTWYLEEDLAHHEFEPIDPKTFDKTSDLTPIQAGDQIMLHDDEAEIHFLATVLGFGPWGQRGRSLFFQLDDGYGDLDLFCGGELIKEAYRNGKPVPKPQE